MKQTRITLRNGTRTYLQDCDTFTLAIHFPGEPGTVESCPELLAAHVSEKSLRKIARGPDRDNYRGKKARKALAIQRHPRLMGYHGQYDET